MTVGETRGRGGMAKIPVYCWAVDKSRVILKRLCSLWAGKSGVRKKKLIVVVVVVVAKIS